MAGGNIFFKSAFKNPFFDIFQITLNVALHEACRRSWKTFISPESTEETLCVKQALPEIIVWKPDFTL
jgi:hypothetical protein